MERWTRFWPPAIVAIAALALSTYLASAPTPVRALAVSAFVLFCPGMAYVRLLQLGDRLAEFVLAVAVSVSLAGVATAVLAVAHAWSATGLLAGLAGFAVLGACLRTRRRPLRPLHEEPLP